MTLFYDAFISYGRVDSKIFATELHTRLTEQGLKVWFDQNDIPLGVDFQNQIDDGIEKAHNFIFVIAPHSVQSEYCHKEILLAIRRNKRIIPILHVEPTNCWEQMHPLIKKLNWIYFREHQDNFETAFTALTQLLHHHANYVKQHTDFLTKALIWERHAKHPNYLLTLAECQQAEAWLTIDFKHEQSPCLPTSLHKEFIDKSARCSRQSTFISYGRADSKAFATQLYTRLTALGIHTWFDQNDIPLGVDFQNQIDDGIEKADNFIFIIAPHSINSEYCLKEVQLAVKLQKRIIPLLHIEEIDYQAWQQRTPDGTLSDWEAFQADGRHAIWKRMHPVIGKLNWIYFNDDSRFEESFIGLVKLIQYHADYVEQHTRFLIKALEWERHQRQTQYLLVGEERTEAEVWLTKRFQGEQPPCVPTDWHCEFICESTKNAHNLMTHVFVSYSTEDKAIMRQINLALMREGITIWTNKTDIKTGVEFQEEINKGIEGADNFIYLISPDALQSRYCQQEVEYALSLNKRFLSLLIRPMSLEEIPQQLRAVQFIDFTNHSDLETLARSTDKLLNELKQAAYYYEQHKILLVKALKWQRQNQNASILLRGHNLQHAETWLKIAQQHTEHLPLPLHETFITKSQQQPTEFTLEVFISYSRADSDFARHLNEALQMQGKTTWFDQESIASGADFQQEIYRGIEQCDNFLFIISPKSVNSPYCADEVEYAESLNKRFITVLYREVPPKELHPALARTQWIDFSQPSGDFYVHFGELIRALDTDREHVRYHTKWSQRALEWAQHKSTDLLLRGNEFIVAKSWLQEAEQKQKQPLPTPLQQEFILSSEQAIETEKATEAAKAAQLLKLEQEHSREMEMRLFQERQSAQRQKWFLSLLSIALLIALGIGVYAFEQKGRVEKQKEQVEQMLAQVELARDEANRARQKADQERQKAEQALQEAKLARDDAKQQEQKAKKQKRLAENAEKRAQQNARDADKQRQLAQDKQQEAEDSANEARISSQLAKKRAWETEQAKQQAEDNANVAQWQAQEAERQTQIAYLEKQHANQQTLMAKHQADLAQREKQRANQSSRIAQEQSISAEKNAQEAQNKTKEAEEAKQDAEQEKELAEEKTLLAEEKTLLALENESNLFATLAQVEIENNNSVTGASLTLAGLPRPGFQEDDERPYVNDAEKQLARAFYSLQQQDNIRLKHNGNPNSFAVSKNGYAVTSYGNTAFLWTTDSGQLLYEWKHDDEVSQAIFNTKGTYVFTVAGKAVSVWNVESGKNEHQWKYPSNTYDNYQQETERDRDDNKFKAVFSPDNNKVITLFGEIAYLWEVGYSDSLRKWKHESKVSQAIFSPDGKQVLTISDNAITQWTTDSDKELKEYEGNFNLVKFSPNGKYVLAYDYDTAYLFNFNENKHQEWKIDEEFRQAEFSPNSKYVLAWTSDNTTYLWDLDSNKLLNEWRHGDYFLGAQFSSDSKQILTYVGDTVYLIDVNSDHYPRYWKSDKYKYYYIDGAKLSSDGNQVLIFIENTIYLWDVNSNNTLHEWQHDGHVRWADFNYDEQDENKIKQVITISDKGAHLWSINQENPYVIELAKSDSNNRVKRINVNTDNRQLLMLSDQSVYLRKINRDEIENAVDKSENVTLEGYSVRSVYATFDESDHLQMISVSSDNKVRLWEISTGNSTLLRDDDEEDFGEVNFVTWSSDGRLAAITSDKTVYLINIDDKKIETKFSLDSKVRQTHFIPHNNGKILTIAIDTVSLWDWHTSTEKPVYEWEIEDYIYRVVLSRDGMWIATLSNQSISLWSVEEQKLIKQFGSDIYYADFDPTNRIMVTTSYSGDVQLWEVETGEELPQKLEGHRQWVNHASFSHDGKLLATASDDKTVRIWDVASGKQQDFLLKHDTWVAQAIFSPTSNDKLLTHAGNTVNFWDLTENPDSPLHKRKCKSWVKQIAFSSDGKQIVMVCYDNSVQLLEVDNNKQVATLKPEQKTIAAILTEDNRTRAVMVYPDRTVYLKEVRKDGNHLDIAKMPHDSYITSAAISPDGEQVLTVAEDNSVYFWKGEIKTSLSLCLSDEKNDTEPYIAFNPFGTQFIILSKDKGQLCDAHDGKLLLDIPEGGDSAVFSSDGNRFVTLKNDKASLWDINQGLIRSVGEIQYVTFDPEGKQVFTALRDGTIQIRNLVDLTLDKEFKKALEEESEVSHATFSLNNEWLVITDKKGVHVWDIKHDRNEVALLEMTTSSLIKYADFLTTESLPDEAEPADKLEIVTLSYDGRVNLWRLFTETEDLTKLMWEDLWKRQLDPEQFLELSIYALQIDEVKDEWEQWEQAEQMTPQLFEIAKQKWQKFTPQQQELFSPYALMLIWDKLTLKQREQLLSQLDQMNGTQLTREQEQIWNSWLNRSEDSRDEFSFLVIKNFWDTLTPEQHNEFLLELIPQVINS